MVEGEVSISNSSNRKSCISVIYAVGLSSRKSRSFLIMSVIRHLIPCNLNDLKTYQLLVLQQSARPTQLHTRRCIWLTPEVKVQLDLINRVSRYFQSRSYMRDSLVMVQAELDLVYNLNWKSSTHVIYVHLAMMGYNLIKNERLSRCNYILLSSVPHSIIIQSLI